MVQTPNYKLEEVVPGQAGREYIINLNSRRIDAYLAGVITRGLSIPPASPPEGAYYIVGGSPSGAWGGKVNNLAIFINGAWDFIVPATGIKVWVIDETKYYQFTGTQWEIISSNVVIPGQGAGLYIAPTTKVITLLKAVTVPITVTKLDPVVTTAGTVTMTMRIGNIPISGLTNVTANLTPSNHTATGNNIVNVGSVLYLEITSVSSSPSAANFSYVFHTTTSV